MIPAPKRALYDPKCGSSAVRQHAARGHDNGAQADAVECFRFLDVLDEADVDWQLSARARGKQPSGGVIEHLGVLQVDLRGVCCEFGGACLEIRESDAKLPKTCSTFTPRIRCTGA